MVWMSKYGWMEPEPGWIFICNQEESIKPKNIVKIDFDSGCWGMGRHPTHTHTLGRYPTPPSLSFCRCLQHRGIPPLSPLFLPSCPPLF